VSPLQRSLFAGWLARTLPFLRDRMLADPRFLFIVCAEVGIDSGAPSSHRLHTVHAFS
jgi:hypothetical protein